MGETSSLAFPCCCHLRNKPLFRTPGGRTGALYKHLLLESHKTRTTWRHVDWLAESAARRIFADEVLCACNAGALGHGSLSAV